MCSVIYLNQAFIFTHPMESGKYFLTLNQTLTCVVFEHEVENRREDNETGNLKTISTETFPPTYTAGL